MNKNNFQYPPYPAMHPNYRFIIPRMDLESELYPPSFTELKTVDQSRNNDYFKPCLSANFQYNEQECYQNYNGDNIDRKTESAKEPINSNGESIQCSECNTVVNNPAGKEGQQQQAHHQKKPFLCETCCKSFKTMYHLNRHEKIHDKGPGGPAMPSASAQPPPEVKRIQVYLCEYCNETFETKVGLTNHKKVHKSKEETSKRSFDGPATAPGGKYVCGYCFAEFEDKNIFQMHCDYHNKYAINNRMPQFQLYHPHGAQGKAGADKSQFEPLIDIISEKSNDTFSGSDSSSKKGGEKGAPEKNFTCHCGKAFKLKQQLQHHAKIHDDVRPFICEVCSKTFKFKQQLQNHLRVHDNIRPFQCNQCDKAFKFKQQLNNHLAKHTGYKPFLCEFCEKAFTFKQQMQVHMKIHIGIKEFGCEVCSKQFRTKQQLQVHMKTHERKMGINSLGVIKGEVLDGVGLSQVTSQLQTLAQSQMRLLQHNGGPHASHLNLNNASNMHSPQNMHVGPSDAPLQLNAAVQGLNMQRSPPSLQMHAQTQTQHSPQLPQSPPQPQQQPQQPQQQQQQQPQSVTTSVQTNLL